MRHFSLRLSLKFILRRIFRFYPLHIITMIASIPITNSLYRPDGYTVLLYNIFMVQSFIPDWQINFSFNAVSWALSNLLFFSILFPLFMPVLHFLRITSKRNSLAMLIFLFVTMGLLVWSQLPFDPIGQYTHWILYIFPYTRCIDFFFGVLLYFYLKPAISSSKGSKIQATLPEIGTLAFLLISILISNYIPRHFLYSLLFLPVSALIIAVFSKEKGFISNFLRLPFFQLLGDIAFPFYMVHLIVLIYIAKSTFVWYVPESVLLIAGVVISLTISILYVFLSTFFKLTPNQKFSKFPISG